MKVIKRSTYECLRTLACTFNFLPFVGILSFTPLFVHPSIHPSFHSSTSLPTSSVVSIIWSPKQILPHQIQRHVVWLVVCYNWICFKCSMIQSQLSTFWVVEMEVGKMCRHATPLKPQSWIMEEISSGSMAFFKSSWEEERKWMWEDRWRIKSLTTIRKSAIKTCKFYFATNHYQLE